VINVIEEIPVIKENYWIEKIRNGRVKVIAIPECQEDCRYTIFLEAIDRAGQYAFKTFLEKGEDRMLELTINTTTKNIRFKRFKITQC